MPASRHRRTRIIATLGPSSNSAETIEALFLAGADVFRLNMSHSDHGEIEALVSRIRKVEERHGRPIGIMADLQGPKVRIGKFAKGSAEVEEGAEFRLDSSEAPGDATRVSLPHPEILKVLKKDMAVLLDDGRVRLEVVERSGDGVTCRVAVGGKLSDRKGVNVPDMVLPISAMTEKDRADLDCALDQEVDWVALSFVQRPEDIEEARRVIGDRAGIMAKIEKPAALTQLPEIVTAADAIMVARGDLGVEAPPEAVPVLQREIIRAARERGRPVVVATQMLESMVQSPVPTRAEVSDVATAVFEDADTVMLSAETATGLYALEAVRIMDRVAREAECDPEHRWRERRLSSDATAEDAITGAARHVADVVGAVAIMSFTTSGSTALRAARERPGVPVIALTPRLGTARRLTMVWGLQPVKVDDATSIEEMIGKATRAALRQEVGKAGDPIVITAGVPFGTPGATNMLHISRLPGQDS